MRRSWAVQPGAGRGKWSGGRRPFWGPCAGASGRSAHCEHSVQGLTIWEHVPQAPPWGGQAQVPGPHCVHSGRASRGSTLSKGGAQVRGTGLGVRGAAPPVEGEVLQTCIVRDCLPPLPSPPDPFPRVLPLLLLSCVRFSSHNELWTHCPQDPSYTREGRTQPKCLRGGAPSNPPRVGIDVCAGVSWGCCDK